MWSNIGGFAKKERAKHSLNNNNNNNNPDNRENIPGDTKARQRTIITADE